MNVSVSFNRDLAGFGIGARPFERTEEIGYAITEMMWFRGLPFYPFDALVDANLATVWLGEGKPQTEETADLVLRFSPSYRGAPVNYYFFEIILRGEGPACYGGYCDGSSLWVTEEIRNGHRIIETEFEGDVWRWGFVPGLGTGPGQYQFLEALGAPGASSFRQRGKRIARAR